MDKQLKKTFEARAAIFKAMAHPTRLFIVDCLSRKKYCVCELTSLIGADISTVSKHLTLLKNAGIVEGEKKGAEIHYSLRVPCILKIFSCVEGVLKNNSADWARLVA